MKLIGLSSLNYNHKFPFSYFPNYGRNKMIQVFGEFLQDLPQSQEYLIVGFSPSSVPLKQRWRTNGLSADFLADYMTTFFTNKENDIDSQIKRAEIKSAVSFIANELLENAMKFNDGDSSEPIALSLHLRSDRIVFLVSNSIATDEVPRFQAYISKLLTLDAQELYINQLEQNAMDENGKSSHLGYLTMIVDYQAQLGWKFESLEASPNRRVEQTVVTTMVQLEV